MGNLIKTVVGINVKILVVIPYCSFAKCHLLLGKMTGCARHPSKVFLKTVCETTIVKNEKKKNLVK